MANEILIAIAVLVIFGIGAACMITRKLPALLTLPLMGAAIVSAGALMQLLVPGDLPQISGIDILSGVLKDGATMLYVPAFVAFFGGVIGFIMQKSGAAESLVKQGAELIGDNPLAVSIFSLLLIAFIFTSIGGLGAIIMTALVILPMLATVGVQPATAGGIFLIGLSLGGVMNAGNWVFYTQAPLNIPLDQVKSFAIIVFFLMLLTGIVFVGVELYRSGASRNVGHILLVLLISFVVGGASIFGLSRLMGNGAGPDSASLPLASGDAMAYLAPPGIEARQALSAEAIGSSNVQGLGAGDPAPELELYEAENLQLPGRLVVHVRQPMSNTMDVLEIRRDSVDEETAEAFFEADWSKWDLLKIHYQGTAKGDIQFRLNGANGQTAIVRGAISKPNAGIVLDKDLSELDQQVLADVRSVVVAFTPDPDAPLPNALTLEFSGWTFADREQASVVVLASKAVFGLAILLILLLALADVWKRIPRWRHQVVTVKWYAYLIPVIPLVLIMVFSVDPIPAFLFGIAYAFLATARPGSISLLIQSLFQGSAAVLPAVLLFVGIGILIRSVIGPAGWSEMHGGADWPIAAAIEPILRVVIPQNPFSYVLIFGIAAPLALYRGPLNTWGLGLALVAVMSTMLPAAAAMAMLLVVGQVQGVCDPTNTHNVWLANELRVDVQKLMWKTLPFIWVMVFAGLIIAGFFTPWLWE
ncbi:MAG: hypothetical protein RLY93_02300 [Sumerlaeia bacterium]